MVKTAPKVFWFSRNPSSNAIEVWEKEPFLLTDNYGSRYFQVLDKHGYDVGSPTDFCTGDFRMITGIRIKSGQKLKVQIKLVPFKPGKPPKQEAD